MDLSLERIVREWAGQRCEYCRIPAIASEFSFPIDHVIARQHAGATALENLALSCPHFNYHKGPNLAGIDPETGRHTKLSHPRRNRWRSHFGWDGPVILAKTAVGRTTLYVLAMNHPDRIEVQRCLVDADLFSVWTLSVSDSSYYGDLLIKNRFGMRCHYTPRAGSGLDRDPRAIAFFSCPSAPGPASPGSHPSTRRAPGRGR